ncbi:MAG: lipoyl synthase [Bacteroidales bacterium]|nr:lipoyl synthase [Bacteroidales bacterium]
MDFKGNEEKRLRKPDWLKIKLPDAYEYAHLKSRLSKNKLHTICESGMCPNIGECWKAGTATFMILGNICTRSCKFCNVETGKPLLPDFEEPQRIANAVKEMNLRHCVITSVDRDDLPDGGAEIWAQTIKAIRALKMNITIECLVPDFNGHFDNLQLIINEKPEIISHNLETVRRLTKEVRVFAKYELSLDVIRHIALSGIIAKSGIMTGLGETKNEIFETMDDLLKVDCQIFTIGQYLQPGINNLPVKRYVSPEEFNEYKITGLNMGFKMVESGPLVRSSYHAELHI